MMVLAYTSSAMHGPLAAWTALDGKDLEPPNRFRPGTIWMLTTGVSQGSSEEKTHDADGILSASVVDEVQSAWVEVYGDVMCLLLAFHVIG